MDYTLDIATWRSGWFGQYQHGEGIVRMLNNEGFSCCLGQFALQRGLSQELLFHCAGPNDVAMFLREEGKEFQYDSNFVDVGGEHTALASALIFANDDENSTARERVENIRTALENAGHTLTVINEHLLETAE